MRAMPADGEWLMRLLRRSVDGDLPLAKAQRDLDCFREPRTTLGIHRDAILNDRHHRGQPRNLHWLIDPHGVFVPGRPMRFQES